MAANVDAGNRMHEIFKKEGEMTDEEIAELRRLIANSGSLTGIFSGSFSNVANIRMNIELIAAIRSFDKASANLITTTNKLTKRILILTYVVVGLGLISVIPEVRDLIKWFFAGK
jgi:hypothetical protein